MGQKLTRQDLRITDQDLNIREEVVNNLIGPINRHYPGFPHTPREMRYCFNSAIAISRRFMMMPTRPSWASQPSGPAATPSRKMLCSRHTPLEWTLMSLWTGPAGANAWTWRHLRAQLLALNVLERNLGHRRRLRSRGLGIAVLGCSNAANGLL
jgi:hypothetical protein